MKTYKIYPVAAPDASTAFQIELDTNVLAASEELENSSIQGEEREETLKKHIGNDYDKGYRGTAWGLHGVSTGLTPAHLAHMLNAHNVSFDPCAERDTYDHSMMVNVEEELAAQLETISDNLLKSIVDEYKTELFELLVCPH